MKHIKDFQFYIKENNGSGRDFEFSIFNIFRPFGRLISNINVNIKLANLINGYDEYLYNVYLEYLNRKTNISVSELDMSDIRVVGKEGKVEIKEFGDDDLSNDKDFDFIPSQDSSTSGEIVATEPEKYSSKKTMNTNSPFIDEVEQQYFSEMIDELVEEGNLFQLRQMRNEYAEAFKKDNNRVQIVRKDINNYNKTKKKFMEDILALDKNSPEYMKTEAKIDTYNKEISIQNDKLTNLLNKIGQHKWYLEETTKAVRYVERIKRTEKEKEGAKKEEPSTLSSVTEPSANEDSDELELQEVHEAKNSWTGGGVIDLSWTNLDMKRINELVNPFHIEEFHLKADLVTSKSKNPEAAKTKWNMYLNSLYKKWYYTYDVRNLRNLSPNLNNTNKADKSEVTIKEELAYSTLILEEMFHNIKSYSYRFKLLQNDKNKYFILLSKSNLLLMKKIMFNNEQYSFQLLSILKPNKDNTAIIATKMLNTNNDKMELMVNEKEVSLYKEKRNYPIFFIQDGNMYVTSDFSNYDSISLRNCNIYSLKDNHFKQIIKNSGVVYEDVLPSQEIFDKIKKTKI